MLDGDRARLSAVLSCLPGGLVVLAPDGRVLEVNDGFRAMTGLTRDDLIGRPLLAHWPEEVRAGLEPAIFSSSAASSDWS